MNPVDKYRMAFLLLLLVTTTVTGCAQSGSDSDFVETQMVLHTATGDIHGTLTTPGKYERIKLALLIAGSGPTDRDGNNPYAMNAGLMKLAHALVKYKIASLRFDKRGISASANAAKSEADLRIDDYINDARDWIALLKGDKRFSEITVIGHSEGSLIGMFAAPKADKFISIAGAGRSADLILKEQLDKQPQSVKDIAFPAIDSLKAGSTVEVNDPTFAPLFRASVQPYMISWFAKDPQVEIKKLSIPVLLIQGTNDLQVSVEDAKLLAKANPLAQLVLIKNMNHIFRIIDGDTKVNLASYGNSSLPVSEELVSVIVGFIKR